MPLDGIYEKPNPDTDLAKKRRSRAYRSQAAFLLRHSDLLIAAANPERKGGAGGTLETAREALSFGLPVIFVHTGKDSDNVYLMSPEDDMFSVLSEAAPTQEQWELSLANWVLRITANPDAGLSPSKAAHNTVQKNAAELLSEYFDHTTLPPKNKEGKPIPSWREHAWNWFQRLATSTSSPKRDPPLSAYRTYRSRATELNYHFAGLYRGAFLLNYVAAVLAVCLAAFSLALLGVTNQTSGVAILPNIMAMLAESDGWLPWVLLGLAATKIALLVFILTNTRRANSLGWNDRAVDYRYLAERLRCMYYLPLVGSHQPPSADPTQFASRAVRQSAMDWLFDAIVRSVSPVDPSLKKEREAPKSLETADQLTKTPLKLVILQPAQALKSIRDDWIVEQAKYHKRTKDTMGALHESFELFAQFLGVTVIAVVFLDLCLVTAEILHHKHFLYTPWATYLDENKALVRLVTAALLFVSTLLPAVVAAMSGLRFQSEANRLAERSAVMRVILAGREVPEVDGIVAWWKSVWHKLILPIRFIILVFRRLFQWVPETMIQPTGGRWSIAQDLIVRLENRMANPDTDLGVASYDVMRVAERVASDAVQEAAEWSVLYAKELSDPG